ncbi:MAG: aminoacyl-tRNA hydrolase [bacterium]|nr:aminoacyl-tRNA hydrolase [bacterium]
MTSAAPLLVVGLGNPGRRYRHTRHNVGFLVVEELARRLGWTFRDGAGPWREAAAPVGEGPFVLQQPLTYMNLSGEAVAGLAAVRGWPLWLPGTAAPAAPAATGPAADPAAGAEPSLPPPVPGLRPLVICDDLALPLGAVRLRAGGSSGGQKGLASVIETLGHDDFPRLRLGIAPQGEPVPPAQWPDFVLTPFTDAEHEVAGPMVAWAADAVTCLVEEGVGAAASRFNRR